MAERTLVYLSIWSSNLASMPTNEAEGDDLLDTRRTTAKILHQLLVMP